MPPPPLNHIEPLSDVVPVPPNAIPPPTHESGGANQAGAVVSRLVRDLESLGRHFLASADSSGETVLDVRAMIMRCLFAPNPRKVWLVKLLPPDTNPMKAPEAITAFQSMIADVRKKNTPALVRVERKDSRDPCVRLVPGWESKFYKVCMSSLETMRTMDKLNELLDLDSTFNTLVAMRIEAQEMHEAFGLRGSVVRTLPLLRGNVGDTVSRYIIKFESGEASDSQVLIGGTFFELLALIREEEYASPESSPNGRASMADRQGARMRNARQQIMRLSITRLLEYIKDASDAIGRFEIARVFNLEEEGIFHMLDDLCKAQRLLRILVSGHDDADEDKAETSDESYESSEGSSPDVSPVSKHVRWKEQVKNRFKRKMREDRRRKRRRQQEGHDPMNCTKNSWTSTPSTRTKRSEKSSEHSDVVFVVGPNGRWIQADVVSVTPGSDQESCRVFVTPRDGLRKGKGDQVLMYSEAAVHTKLHGSGRQQYEHDLDQAIKARLAEEEEAKANAQENEAQEAKLAEEQMSKPTMKMAIQASLSAGKIVKSLVAWGELAESRQLKDKEEVAHQASRYWNYIKAVEHELKATLLKDKKPLKLAWTLDPEGRGSANRWVALAHVLGKPTYSPPHSDPELELKLAAKRMLLSRFVLGQLALIAGFLVFLLAGIILLSMEMPLLIIGVLLVLIAPVFLRPALKIHRHIRELIQGVPVTPLHRRVLERRFFGGVGGVPLNCDRELKPIPREAWAD